jgi:hypothetical protein
VSRKFAGISLLICLVVPVLALYVWTQHQKHEVRRAVKWRMAANLDKDEMVLLKFTDEDADSQLRWKHSKEFEFQGFMYDIVQQELHGDTTYYYCWLDKEETELNQRLDELAALAFSKDPKNKENREKLSSFFKSLFHKDSDVITAIHEDTAIMNSKYEESYFLYRKPPRVPPPRCS